MVSIMSTIDARVMNVLCERDSDARLKHLAVIPIIGMPPKTHAYAYFHCPGP